MKGYTKWAFLGLATVAIAAVAALAGGVIDTGVLEVARAHAPGTMEVFGAMAVVQSSYSENQGIGFPGQIASMHSYDSDSLIVENSNGIPFGCAVGQGTAYNQCRLGAAAAGAFRGISIRDNTLPAVAADSDYVDEYPRYQLAGVMTRGDIWVLPDGNVSPGNDVTYNATTGRLSSAAAGAGQFAITGARWLTAGSTSLVAKVRLSGHQHSA